MAKRKRLMIVVLFLTSLVFMGFITNGYSQQDPETSKKPAAGQKQPAERQPFQNRLLWQAGLEVVAELSANQLSYTGTCPTVFTFKGGIYSNRAMTAHYRFIRSDDVYTTAVALKLEKDEKKEITYSWELGDPSGPPEFNGSIFLQVLYPTNLKSVSNVVNLKGNCTNREKKSAQDNTKQQNSPGPQQGQKAPGPPFTGSPAQLPEGKGPVPTGPSMIQPGQKGQSVTGGTALMPSPQSGQGPGGMPMFQPGQTGQGPGSMSMPQPGQAGQGPGGMLMVQPGQKGPMPVEPPILPGIGKGPVPSNLPIPQPDVKALPGAEK